MRANRIGWWRLRVLCFVGCLCSTAAVTHAASLSVTVPQWFPAASDFLSVCVQLESEGSELTGVQMELVWELETCLAFLGNCEMRGDERPVQYSLLDNARLSVVVPPLEESLDPLPDGELFCCDFERGDVSRKTCRIMIENATASLPDGQTTPLPTVGTDLPPLHVGPPYDTDEFGSDCRIEPGGGDRSDALLLLLPAVVLLCLRRRTRGIGKGARG